MKSEKEIIDEIRKIEAELAEGDSSRFFLPSLGGFRDGLRWVLERRSSG